MGLSTVIFTGNLAVVCRLGSRSLMFYGWPVVQTGLFTVMFASMWGLCTGGALDSDLYGESGSCVQSELSLTDVLRVACCADGAVYSDVNEYVGLCTGGAIHSDLYGESGSCVQSELSLTDVLRVRGAFHRDVYEYVGMYTGGALDNDVLRVRRALYRDVYEYVGAVHRWGSRQ